MANDEMLLDALARAVAGPGNDAARSSTHAATVTRLDPDGTMWVSIPGGANETPVRTSLVTAEPGDVVQVTIADGRATATGNESSPAANASTVTAAVEPAIQAAAEVKASLVAESAKIAHLEADTAKVHDLTADQLTAAVGYIDDLTSASVTAEQLAADHATVGSLDANYAQIGLANVNTAQITNGIIQTASIVDEQVFTVSGNKATIARIDASKINVENLNADNITVNKINGQPVTGKSISDALSQHETDISTKVDTTTFNNTVDGLNDRIDGAIETFTGTVVPTLNNTPASAWNTTKLRDEHVGDVYYVVNSSSQQNGYCYRFTKSGSEYSWQLIKDSDVTAALSRLQTAEGKITTFDSDISTLKTDTGELKTKTQSLETSLGDKVDVTTFNDLSSDVESNSSTITRLSETVSQKADSSTVTTLSNTVNQVKQTATGNSSKLSQLTQTLGTNSDGTTKANDIVHRTSAVEQDLSGFKTTVSNTYTTKTEFSGTKTYVDNAKANYGYQYKKDIVVYGDSDKYYPVYFTCIGFAQTVTHNVMIMRGYSEQAPADWNTSTHKGGLNLHFGWNFGGWGGATYKTEIYEFTELYSTMLGDIIVGADAGMFSIVYLRGGGTTGALYHIYSDVPFTRHSYMTNAGVVGENDVPYIGLEQGVKYAQSTTGDNPTYKWNVRAPLTAPNIDHINQLYTAQRAALTETRVTAAETAIDQNADAIELRATKAEFDALSIGGRNLLRNSLEMKLGTSSWENGIWRVAGNYDMAKSHVEISDGPLGQCGGLQLVGTQTTTSDASCYGIDSMPRDIDGDYVFSMFARVVGGGVARAGFAINSGTYVDGNDDGRWASYYTKTLDPTGKWTRIWTHWKSTAATGNVYIGGAATDTSDKTIQMCLVQIESGTKPTDWTPAPEDMATQTDLNTAKAEIKVTTDGINSEVSKISSAKYVNARMTSWTLANLRTYASEGHQENWGVDSTNGLRVGDVVYVKGTDGTRNVPIYVKTTVKSINSTTTFTGISHGMEDILPVDSAISSINQSAESVRIKAERVEIDGAAVFKAANSIPDTRGTNQNPQWYFTNYPKQSVTEFKQSSVIGLSGEMYCYVTTVTGWNDSSGGYPKQTAKIGDKTYWRVGTSNTAWGAWQETESTSGAQKKVTEAVDNLQIGGRNLLGNTENRSGSVIVANSDTSSTFGTIGNYNDSVSWYSLVNYDGYSNAVSCATSTNTGNRGVGWYTKAGEILAGETYTFSCRIKCSIATNVHMHTAWRNGSATAGYTGWTAGGITAIPADTWTDYSLTFVPHVNAKLDWELFVAICITGSSSGATYQVAHAKLEKGTKATDWTPAPEDVDARIKVGSRNIFLNSGRATLSGVANQNNSYTSALTVSETIPAGTEVTVSCQIDATNLTWGSSGQKRAGVEFSVGSSTLQYIGAWAGAALSEYSNVVKVLTGTWSGRISKTVTLKYDLPKGRTYGIYVQQLGSGTCVVSKPKLEIGNRATDWDTAPEETVRRTQRIYYRKTVTGAPAAPSSWVVSSGDGSNAWTQKHISINREDKYIYTCEQYEMADGTLGNTSILLDDTITVIDGGKILTGTVEANALKAKSLSLGYFTDAAANSIDNSKVQVGGRNLLPYSKPSADNMPKVSTANATNTFVTEDGFDCYKGTGAGTSFAFYASNGKLIVPLEASTQYIYSAWVKLTTTTSATSVPLSFSSLGHFTVRNENSTKTDKTHEDVAAERVYSPSTVTIGQWTKITLTFTTNELAGSHFGVYSKYNYGTEYTLFIRDMKLEKGNKATDWTPAPEDVDNSIFSTRQDFNDQIDPINESIETLSNGITDHGKRLAATEDLLAQVKNMVDNLENTTSWLSFNEDNGLIIGDNPSDGSSFFYTQQKGSFMSFNQASAAGSTQLMKLSGENGIEGPKVTVNMVDADMVTIGDDWSITTSGGMFAIDYIGS